MPRLLFGLSMVALFSACASAQDLAWKQLPPIPDALGVAGAFAGVSDGALLVMGGANFPDRMPWDGGRKVWHDEVYVLESPEGAWSMVDRLPRPLAYGISVQTPKGVLCIGGNDAEQHYADVFLIVLDRKAVILLEYPPLPIPLANACGALVGTTVFVAGGESQPNATQCSTGFFALDIGLKAPEWKTLPACPGDSPTLAVAAAAQGRFLLMGGVSLSAGSDGKPFRRYLKSCNAYDPAKNAWEPLADLPLPAAAAPTPAPVPGGNKLLILGGDDGSRYGFQPLDKHPGFPGTTLAYDVVKNAWSVGKPVPAPRATLPAVLWNNRIVLPSGEARPGVRSPEVWTVNMAEAGR
jgi:N-acetylneuraminic acid mutarotase